MSEPVLSTGLWAFSLTGAAASAAWVGSAAFEWRQQRRAFARALGRQEQGQQPRHHLRDVLKDAAQHAADILDKALPRAWHSALSLWLAQAGDLTQSPGSLILASLAWAVIPCSLGLALGFEEFSAAFLLLGALPGVRLKDAQSRRQKTLRKGLPDALDLLTACVQAGLGLEQAIARVAERLEPGPLQKEWQRSLAGMRMGQARRAALRELEQRMALEEMSQVVGAIIQAEARGVALAPALKAQSSQMRRLKALRVQKAAAEAPLKMLFPLMVFILPVVFIVLFGPILLGWNALGL